MSTSSGATMSTSSGPTRTSSSSSVPFGGWPSPPLPPPPPTTTTDVYNGVNPHYPGGNVQLLHRDPPVYGVYDFLTHDECRFLIEAASDSFTPAPVVGRGVGEVSHTRTASTCYLAREDLPNLMRKVSMLTGKPMAHMELPQVGRYLPSQQYYQVSSNNTMCVPRKGREKVSLVFVCFQGGGSGASFLEAAQSMITFMGCPPACVVPSHRPLHRSKL
jgi:hypothetical protein